MYEEFHYRRGYFRRAKNGDYIKRDGKYEQVRPGEGNYIWIRSKYQRKPTKTSKEGD